MTGRLITAILAYVARLRFPTLFLLTAALFVLDVIVPDAIPLADELLLGLATALLASWRRQKKDGDAIDVESTSGPNDPAPRD